MHLDVHTLAVVTVFITALLGALLVFAGLQNRSIRAPMWWGAAHIVNASGLGLLSSHGAAPDFVTNDLANALVLLGYGLTWSGARVFDGRKVYPPLLLLAPAIWLALCRLPAFANADLRVVVVSTMLAFLALRAAEELWRGRDEPLMSRWPSVIVLLAYAAVLLARVPATLLTPSFQDDSLMRGLSFALLAFGTLLFTVVMAFLQLNMTKERIELKHKINSLVDPLSGVANRRAFLDGAAGLLARQEVDREPLAVLLFDLDHFKQINDQFGHAIGDSVLQAFAGTATKTLGADDPVRPHRRRGICRLHRGRRRRRGLCHRRSGTAQLRRGGGPLRQRPPVAERQRRRHAGLRSARHGRGIAFDRRPGAVPGQGARTQSRRDGNAVGYRFRRRRAFDRADHRSGSRRLGAAIGRPALAHRLVRLVRDAPPRRDRSANPEKLRKIYKLQFSILHFHRFFPQTRRSPKPAAKPDRQRFGAAPKSVLGDCA